MPSQWRMSLSEAENVSDATYAFKPSLMGAMCGFTLRPDALVWQVGRRSGNIPYDSVTAVRLSYRPVTMASHRFTTEIWSRHSPKIQIVSTSWRSIVEQERLDAAYSTFVAELHRRLAAAGAGPRFSSGLPAVTYWVGVVVFAAVLGGIAILTARTAFAAQWAATAIVAIFFLVFAYQLGNYFWRNRPGRYRPDAIPPVLLPRA
jgi:hypothetical protein